MTSHPASGLPTSPSASGSAKTAKTIGIVSVACLAARTPAPSVASMSTGSRTHASASVGIAFTAAGDGDAELLVRDADTAMYRAKERGRGGYEVFDEAVRERVVARLRTEEGYMAEVTALAGTGTLTEHNCAIPAVAERFPEICAAEARFLADVLGAEVERRGHMLDGCSACEYHVRFKSAQENS